MVEGGELNGTVPQILARGGMKIKFMAVAGDPDPEEAVPLGGKVLGVPYKLSEDLIEYGIYPVITEGLSRDKIYRHDLEEVDQLEKGELGFTLRKALSLVMSCYDPMGLVSPALVRGKLLLRNLYSKELRRGWMRRLERMRSSSGGSGLNSC